MFEFDVISKDAGSMTPDECHERLGSMASIIVPSASSVPDGLAAFEVLVLSACSDDGNLPVREKKLFEDSMGIVFPYKHVEKFIESNGGSLDKASEVASKIFESFSSEIRIAMLSFCIMLSDYKKRPELKGKSIIARLVEC